MTDTNEERAKTEAYLSERMGADVTITDHLPIGGMHMVTGDFAAAYLGPVRDELDRLRAALAAADRRITDLTVERDSERAFLKQRSDAVNRVGASNDTLRATIARVESFAQSNAIAAHALGLAVHERNWLDLLAILERGEVAP